VGTDRGGARFDGTTWTTFNDENSGLPGSPIYAVVARNGAVWFATDGGITKYDGASWEVFNSANSALIAGKVLALAFDRQGNLWAGIQGMGYGLAHFDGATWKVYTAVDMGFPCDGVAAVAIDSSDNVWFGMRTKGLARFDGSGWLYFGQNDSAEVLASPSSLIVDPTGQLIIGTKGTGAFTFRNLNEWGRFKPSPSGLLNFDASTLALDRAGNLWFAGGWSGNSLGVQRYDGTGWKHYNVANSGLPEGNVNAVAFDSAGGVWFGTRAGIGVLRGGVASVPSSSGGSSTSASSR